MNSERKGTAVFLDASIQIARAIREEAQRDRIAERIRLYDISVTSLVVKQEFKRRLLGDAQYLLNLLNRKNSYEAVRAHVTNVLPKQQNRKRTICLNLLAQAYHGRDDADLTERARRMLRAFMLTALDAFDKVGHLIKDSGCACASYPVTEVKPYKRYQFGPNKCSVLGGVCGVVAFLKDQEANLSAILQKLQGIPDQEKSPELRKAEDFIRKALDDPEQAQAEDPCLTVGDLMIALESVKIPHFYTMNGKESQHLCKALGQTLIVRRNNPEHDDVVCQSADANWPRF